MHTFMRFLLPLFLFIHFVVPDEGAGANDDADDNKGQDDPATQSTQLPDEKELEKELTKEEARLESLQEEYTQMADSIRDEFNTAVEQTPSEIFSDEELEMLEVGSNIAAKTKLINEKFENFRDKKLAEKKEIISEFENGLNQKRKSFDFVSNSNRFSRENPDVDMEKLAEFIQEDLTPRQKKEMLEAAGDNKYKFLELAANQMNGNKENEANEDDEFPTDLNDLQGMSPDFNEDQNNEDYLKKIGVA